jgi:hypothetical protein
MRTIRQLGYRGSVLHYVGMSHFFQLTASGSDFLVGLSSDPLCGPARAWHAEFFATCKAWGYSPISSLSYEVLASHCPAAWQQRAANGDAALTGWSPPSTLMSPANTAAMAWQQSVAAAFAQLMVDAGCDVRFQVGEPWWWVMADGRICIYDDAAKASFGGNPVAIPDLRAPLNSAQTALLDQAGAMLAASTIALANAARAVAQSAGAVCETLLLTFVPTVLDAATPEASGPTCPWAGPALPSTGCRSRITTG